MSDGAADTARDGSPVELYELLPSGEDPATVHRAVPDGADVLDLGCGTGRIGVPLAGLGHRVLGVDESAEMLARAGASGSIETLLARIEDVRLDRRFGGVCWPATCSTCRPRAPAKRCWQRRRITWPTAAA